jgi:sugar fermentation stimulation protein A
MIAFPNQLLPATFVRRDNRFRVAVALEGREVAAHLANPGRLAELMVAGAECYVTEAMRPGRKTGYDLKLLRYAGALVSVDSPLAADLFADALASGPLPPFEGYHIRRREVQRGTSRLDFLLESAEGGRCWVETKAVSLVVGGCARFPDAPTVRGRRHLEELMAARASGDAAAVVFVIQRPDACQLTPHEANDPAFARTLRMALEAGVMAYAYTCRVSTDGAELLYQVPVRV